MNNKPFFLSYYLSERTPVYGGEKGVISFEKIRSIERGDNSNNLKLTFPTHVGTHIDFPSHFGLNGKKCEDYAASFWIFNKVGFLECSLEEVSDRLTELPADIELLILKTGFGIFRGEQVYWANQPVIHSSLAEKLKRHFPNLRVFGFDMISLTSKLDREEGKNAHINFLIRHDILVLEDMNLCNLKETPAKVIISPLQVQGAEGVPCTIFAIPFND
jgi:kynurenine formamidase